MKRLIWFLGVAPLVAACGPSYGGQDVKTPEELVAEQERLADEQAAQEKQQGPGTDEETDLEKKAKFDKHQAELELKRAQRSAESCAGVVTEQGPGGTAKLTLTFDPDGHVKDGSISAPFDGTKIGECALGAMKKVIVPPFDGGDETLDWEIDLTPKEEPKADSDKDKDKKKKK